MIEKLCDKFQLTEHEARYSIDDGALILIPIDNLNTPLHVTDFPFYIETTFTMPSQVFFVTGLSNSTGNNLGFSSFRLLNPPCNIGCVDTFTIPTSREIAVTYLYGFKIFSTTSEIPTLQVVLGWWPQSFELERGQRKAHDGVVYQGGDISYIDGLHSQHANGVRPSCLDVWTNHLEEKYFNRWRKALRVIKAQRYRDLNAEMMWSCSGPISKVNKYAQLCLDHKKNVEIALKYGWM